MTGTFERLDGNVMTLTHPGKAKPTHHNIAPGALFLLNKCEAKRSHLRKGDTIDLEGEEPYAVVKAVGSSHTQV